VSPGLCWANLHHITYEDLPVRSFSTAEALKAAVDGVLDDHVQRIAQSTRSLAVEL
jgi:hypothetical protein